MTGLYSPHPIGWFMGALCWIWLSAVAFSVRAKVVALVFLIAAATLFSAAARAVIQ